MQTTNSIQAGERTQFGVRFSKLNEAQKIQARELYTMDGRPNHFGLLFEMSPSGDVARFYDTMPHVPHYIAAD